MDAGQAIDIGADAQPDLAIDATADAGDGEEAGAVDDVVGETEKKKSTKTDDGGAKEEADGGGHF